jgi:transposase
MTTEERRRRRFSEDFRMEQVRLIESGKVTLGDVSQLYQVKRSSVRRWLVRYGQKELPGKIVISQGKEFDRIGALEKENRNLMELIGRQQVELTYKNELIRLAKEKLGKDFEKK